MNFSKLLFLLLLIATKSLAVCQDLQDFENIERCDLIILSQSMANNEVDQNLIQTSMGARIVHQLDFTNTLALMPHWIEIHEDDFGLNMDLAPLVWSRLLEINSENSHVSILSLTEDSGGHDFRFWRARLTLSLEWLLGSLGQDI